MTTFQYYIKVHEHPRALVRFLERAEESARLNSRSWSHVRLESSEQGDLARGSLENAWVLFGCSNPPKMFANTLFTSTARLGSHICHQTLSLSKTTLPNSKKSLLNVHTMQTETSCLQGKLIWCSSAPLEPLGAILSNPSQIELPISLSLKSLLLFEWQIPTKTSGKKQSQV